MLKKRVLALIVALSMLSGMFGAASAAESPGFADMPDDWSRPALERAVSNGLLSGSNGRINASGMLTRAEMASIVVRAFGAESLADLSAYTDVSPSDWFYTDLRKAVAMGVISGSNGRLNPNAPITREEVCAVLYRAFVLQDGGNIPFGDASAVSGWAQQAVAAMAAGGYLTGDAQGNVNPARTITRAEFAQLLDNLVKGYPSGAANGVIEGSAVVKTAGTDLSGAVIKGDLILADGLGAADVDLSGCTVEGRIIIRGGSGIRLPGETPARHLVAAAPGSVLSLTGKADTVEIRADNVTLTAENGSEIRTVEVRAKDATVRGSGKVETVAVRAGSSGTEVTTGNTQITTIESGADVRSHNGALSAGQTGTTNSAGSLIADPNDSDKPSDSSQQPSSSGDRPSRPSRPSESTEQYAVTAANGQLIGYFDAGTRLTVDPANGEAAYTVTVSDTVTIPTPERTGYTFNGWTVSGTSLTAQWKKNDVTPPEQFTVIAGNGQTIGTFDAGTQLTVDPANGEAAYTVTVSDETAIPTPVRAGFVFAGWKVSGTSLTAHWAEEGTILIDILQDLTMEAGTQQALTITTEPADCTILVTSSDPAVAQAAQDGAVWTLSAVSAGQAVITVTASKAGYPDASESFTVTVTGPVVESTTREEFNFNAGWIFSKGHGWDNAESNRDIKREVVVLPVDEKPYETGYVPGASWEAVSLPHTYNDVDTFDNFTETGMNGERSVYSGTAWYKKTFTIPAAYQGKKIFLEFEAARQAAEVYLNGVKLEGKCENGFIPFGYDLTEYIRFGEENDITVMVDNSFPYYHIGDDGSKNELSWHDSHWHPNNGGLYRNATLYVTDPLHVTLPLYSFLNTQGTYVYTRNETEASADVVMEAEIQNEYDTDKTFTYVAEIRDMDGRTVCTETSGALTLPAGGKQVYSLTAALQNPKFWSTEYPYLYEVVTKVLVDGEEIDSSTTPLGVRVFRFTNDNGLFLNENYVKLKGWGQKPTDEWAGLGAAYPDWMHAYTQELMKDAGGNFIRWGHCAGSPTQIGISDQYGIVTLQPGVDGEGSTVGGVYSELSYQVRKNAFRDMIIYYRNNPSIFLWEVGNQSMPDAEAKALTDLIYQYDSHGMQPEDKQNSGTYDETAPASNRLIAVRRGNNVMSKYIDVSVTTLGDWELKADGKPGVEGEYNREEARRGVWDRYTPGFEDFKTPSGSSYNLTDEQYAANQAKEWNSKLKAVEHSGGGNWIFSDSTSHGRVYSEVSRASGEVDAVRLPKEAYYTLKTIYTDETDVYLIGHWNYPADTVKDVFAVSDAASVKLVVEGEDGTQEEYNGVKSNDYLFTFSGVTYRPGRASAIAYDKQGREVGRSVKATHGEAAALKITPITGAEGLLANGSDILLLDVEAVDADGNRCLTFDGTVNGLRTTFEINDSNGCSIWRGGYNSGIEHSTNNKYLYLQGGINRVAVRTTMKPGDITVTASTEGLAPASITVTSKAIDNTGGLNRDRNQFKQLALDPGKYQGMGDGEKPPERDDGTVTEQKSALLKEAFYTGSSNPWKLTFPAIRDAQVYSDDKDIVFGDLPIQLLNSEYLQIPQADANLTGATDVISLRFARNVDLYIAHDDTVSPRPGWITSGYDDTGMDIEINGHSHSVFHKAFPADAGVTLESNVTVDMTQGGNQYVVFFKEQGQSTTFLKDDFEGQTAGESPLGWVVNTAPDTSAKIAEIDGNKVLELIDTNTGSAPNMALVSRKFLPQSGKFAIEYKVYDYNLTVNNKNQDYVRIFLLKNAPSSNPNDHTGTVVESYLRAGSKLGAREPSGSGTKDIDIKQLAAEQWFTVRYIVDIENGSFDAYVWDETQQRFNLEKSGVGFRNNHAYVDHLVLGSGGGSGTHVLIDDVKIELIDNALSEIQVDGEPLRDFDPDTLTYTHTLPFGTDPSAVPAVTATARDPYATVEITQAANANGTATIEVTALNGDSQTYTVAFEVADAVNETVADILLDGKSFKGFQADTTGYDIILPPGAEIPEVTVDKLAASDNVTITGTDTVTISVNSTGEYTLRFTNAGYELNENFEGSDLPSGWTTAASADDGAGSVSVTDGALVLNDTDNKMYFAFGELEKTYTSDNLAGKQLVMELDVKPGNGQQWIRALFTNGTNADKPNMAIEPYINAKTKNGGDYTYRSGDGTVATNNEFSPVLGSGTVKTDEWNHIKIALSVDDGAFSVTVTNADGTTATGVTTKADAIRENDTDRTKITHVHFGTGGVATGVVSYDNVKVYVCSDIS